MKTPILALAAFCLAVAAPSWSEEWTGGTGKITAPSGTKVGIGTLNPDVNLQVSGSNPVFRVTDPNSGGSSAIGLQAEGQLTRFKYYFNDRFAIDNGDDFPTGTEYLTIKRNGFVGIGTTTPTNLLDVVGGTVSQSVNSNSVYMNGIFRNTSTGNTALSILELGESATGSLRSQYYGSGFTSVGYNVASSGMLTTGSAATGGMTMLVQANAPFRVYTNAAERYTISGEGVHSLTGPVNLSSTLGTAGLITATGGIMLNGGADGPGRITKHATHGIIHQGVTGSLNDWVLFNQAGHYLINNPTGTESLEFKGAGSAYSGPI